MEPGTTYILKVTVESGPPVYVMLEGPHYQDYPAFEESDVENYEKSFDPENTPEKQSGDYTLRVGNPNSQEVTVHVVIESEEEGSEAIGTWIFRQESMWTIHLAVVQETPYQWTSVCALMYRITLLLLFM